MYAFFVANRLDCGDLRDYAEITQLAFVGCASFVASFRKVAQEFVITAIFTRTWGSSPPVNP